jgi:hypothetical protein
MCAPNNVVAVVDEVAVATVAAVAVGGAEEAVDVDAVDKKLPLVAKQTNTRECLSIYC